LSSIITSEVFGSWGAAITGEFATTHPEQVDKLVLYGPGWLPPAGWTAPPLGGCYRTMDRETSRERVLSGIPSARVEEIHTARRIQPLPRRETRRARQLAMIGARSALSGHPDARVAPSRIRQSPLHCSYWRRHDRYTNGFLAHTPLHQTKLMAAVSSTAPARCRYDSEQHETTYRVYQLHPLHHGRVQRAGTRSQQHDLRCRDLERFRCCAYRCIARGC
jgi:pimeloyl-ACP methyl ester carboxylesterase